MRYRTKKEILEHLGKDGKDVRYLDRAVASGEIIVRDRMYITSKEYIEELEKKLTEEQRIDVEIKPIVDENINQESMVDKNINLSDLEKKLAESEDNLSYQMKEYERLERETKEEVWMYQECIRKCYLWATNEKRIKITRPDFRDNVLKLKKSLPGEDNQ